MLSAISVSSSCINASNLPWYNSYIAEVCNHVLANVVPFLGGTSATITLVVVR